MSQPMPRAAIFDLDGTLADTAPDLHLLLSELLAEQGLAAPSPEAVRSMVGDGVAMLIRRATTAVGRPVDDAGLDRLYERFMVLYGAAPCRLTTLYPNAREVLADLADQGVRLGICTNKPQRPTELILDALGVGRHFGAIVGGDQLPVRKPHPDHLGEVLRRLGVEPADTVMIGDSRNDLASARGLGMSCVLVRFGYSSPPASELGADAMIDDFAELPTILATLWRAPAQGALLRRL